MKVHRFQYLQYVDESSSSQSTVNLSGPKIPQRRRCFSEKSNQKVSLNPSLNESNSNFTGSQATKTKREIVYLACNGSNCFPKDFFNTSSRKLTAVAVGPTSSMRSTLIQQSSLKRSRVKTIVASDSDVKALVTESSHQLSAVASTAQSSSLAESFFKPTVSEEDTKSTPKFFDPFQAEKVEHVVTRPAAEADLRKYALEQPLQMRKRLLSRADSETSLLNDNLKENQREHSDFRIQLNRSSSLEHKMLLPTDKQSSWINPFPIRRWPQPVAGMSLIKLKNKKINDSQRTQEIHKNILSTSERCRTEGDTAENSNERQKQSIDFSKICKLLGRGIHESPPDKIQSENKKGEVRWQNDRPHSKSARDGNVLKDLLQTETDSTRKQQRGKDLSDSFLQQRRSLADISSAKKQLLKVVGREEKQPPPNNSILSEKSFHRQTQRIEESKIGEQKRNDEVKLINKTGNLIMGKSKNIEHSNSSHDNGYFLPKWWQKRQFGKNIRTEVSTGREEDRPTKIVPIEKSALLIAARARILFSETQQKEGVLLNRMSAIPVEFDDSKLFLSHRSKLSSTALRGSIQHQQSELRKFSKI